MATGFTLPNGQYIPAFLANDLQFTPGQQYTYGDANPQTATTPGQWRLNNVGNYFPGWENLNPSNWVFSSWNKDTGMDDPNLLNLMVKSGETEGTVVPFQRQGDQWVPNQQGAYTQQWDTNANNRMRNMALGTIAALWGGPQLMAGFGGAPAGAEVPIAQTGGMSVPGASGGMSVPAGAGVSLPGTVAGSTLPWYNAAAAALPYAGAAGSAAGAAGSAAGAAGSAAGTGSAAGGAGSTASSVGGGLLNWMKDNPGLALTAAGLLGGLAGNAGSQVEDLYGGRKTAIDRLNANKLPAGPWGRY